jgi:hypothetical protein
VETLRIKRNAKNKNKPGMLAYTCNPSTWKAEIRWIMVEEQPRQKLMRPHLQPVEGHNSNAATQEAEIRRIRVPDQPGQNNS